MALGALGHPAGWGPGCLAGPAPPHTALWMPCILRDILSPTSVLSAITGRGPFGDPPSPSPPPLLGCLGFLDLGFRRHNGDILWLPRL